MIVLVIFCVLFVWLSGVCVLRWVVWFGWLLFV